LRAKSELREEDEKLSNTISDFLDKTFYAEETTDFTRNNDKTLQVCGIDTIFIYDGTKYECDEKAAVRYRNLKTFALELSFINKNGDLNIGWLLDKKNRNNSYLFVWIDVSEIEVALVEKVSIFQYLESIGWTKEHLFKKQQQIRDAFDNSTTVYLGKLDDDGIKFHYSNQLVEKPINILLYRDTFRKLSVFNKVYKTKQFDKQ
jgi:hypothetical protein